ncbi:hypothetical protein C5E06_03900 [Pseudoclavibacter sp. RFBI5]|uniref:alginate O-acetyltransferase AlgX-related protein n=1 Tax=Pseudoclavibacter sp. RFBI5 TaxID=2080578 RepID=UPI000CE8C1B9|nr:hypothetical protein [Pseudoclavibacter sp. RFBI5]PPG05024.1 hypothetical protein C5E06_03900 [Pseudoclavibacter sp. RFBI5]
MTSTGPGSLRPESGFEEPPSKQGRVTWAQRWHRVRLIPFILLLVCALIAVISGRITQQSLAAADALPPEQGPASAAFALPQETCAPTLANPVTGNPWSAENADASEAAFEENMGALPAGGHSYVEGNDDWVFWGDEQANNFSQALGRSYLGQEEAEEWASYFRTVQAQLAQQGTDLIIQVVPADWAVLPEELPGWAQELRGPTNLDHLHDAYPDLPIMDTRQPLRDAAVDGDVYAKRNSHWTPFGGAVGWATLADCLGSVDAKYEPLAPLDFSELEPVVVSSEFEAFGLPSLDVPTMIPSLEASASPMSVSFADGSTEEMTTNVGLDMLLLPATTVTESPQSDLKALVLRDSQGSNIAAGWQAGFASTKQIRHSFDDPNARVDVLGEAAEFQPDVVIYEITERHLNFVPVLPE